MNAKNEKVLAVIKSSIEYQSVTKVDLYEILDSLKVSYKKSQKKAELVRLCLDNFDSLVDLFEKENRRIAVGAVRDVYHFHSSEIIPMLGFEVDTEEGYRYNHFSVPVKDLPAICEALDQHPEYCTLEGITIKIYSSTPVDNLEHAVKIINDNPETWNIEKKERDFGGVYWRAYRKVGYQNFHFSDCYIYAPREQMLKNLLGKISTNITDWNYNNDPYDSFKINANIRYLANPDCSIAINVPATHQQILSMTRRFSDAQ